VKMHAHWRVVREGAYSCCRGGVAPKNIYLDLRVCSRCRLVYRIARWQCELSVGVLGVGNAVVSALGAWAS
jgi:hypothetical protein